MSLSRIERALKQPIYLLSADHEEPNEWVFQVQGFSGNHYTVNINSEECNCTCPDYTQRHNICKHVFFIIGRIAQDQNCLLKFNKSVNIFDIKPDLTQILKKRLVGRLGNVEVVAETEKSRNDFEDCCICFEDVIGNNTNFQCFQCKQYIHKQCITKWKKNTCPL